MKMKTMIALTLACVCLLTVAYAENTVPSPSLQTPTVQIVVNTNTTGETLAPDSVPDVQSSLVIEEVKTEAMPESTLVLFEQIQMLQQLVTEPTDAAAVQPTEGEQTAVLTQPVKVDLAQIVPEETITAIQETLPETSSVEELVITEFVPLSVSNYDDTLGNVQVQIVSVVKYQPEENVTALVGVWDGEKMVWFVPELIVGEDGVVLNFTSEMLAMMNGAEPVLLLMSDMQEQQQMEPAAL